MSPSPSAPGNASQQALISIGSHSLSLYSHGPPRIPGSNTPAVIIITGFASSQLGWSAVARLLAPTLPVYTYDRSGYGASSPSPLAPNGENIAYELDLLLQNAGIEGPWILVAHSWGGVLVREFLVRCERAGRIGLVAGLVLVDANQELTVRVLDWRNQNLAAVVKGLHDHEILGLTSGNRLARGEWEALLEEEASEKHQLQAQKEMVEYEPSMETLLMKGLRERHPPMLGEKPVCVVRGSTGRDFEKLYKAGIEKGNGSEEERRLAREFLKTWDEKDEGLQREHLKLSSIGRYVVAEESGHNVQLTQPGVIVDGVKWVLKEYQSEINRVGKE